MQVVVVGAGVVGAACAYELAKAGAQVTLIDRGLLGSGCSHANCGYICPSHVLPLASPGAIRNTLQTLLQRNSPLKVHPGFLFKNLSWFLRFARRCNQTDMLKSAVGIQALLNSSRQLFNTLLTTESMQVEFDPVGLLFVFQSLKAFEHYAEVDELLRHKFGMPADRFDATELQALEPALKPGSAAGGYLYRSDAQLRPDRLMTEWRRVLLHHGVNLQEKSELLELKLHGDKAQAVRTSRGEIVIDAVVLATGAWTPLLTKSLGVNLPIVPGKGYSVTMPRPKICPKYPMIFEEHRVAVSPFASNFRIGSTMEFAGYDTTLPEQRLELLRLGAEHYLPEPWVEPIEERWWGWRPMTPDGLPVIDRCLSYRNVLIAAGHGLLGLSMATGTGRLVRELLFEEHPHIDPQHYRLTRF